MFAAPVEQESASGPEADPDDEPSDSTGAECGGDGDHTDMLNDAERNRRYHRALARVLARQPLDRRRVIDIGAGTGLLAMLAARQGASSVVACELDGAMSAIAIECQAANGLADVVEWHAVPSQALDLPPDRLADVLVTETFDSELLGEGVLPLLRDALGRLVSPHAIVIPARARVWGQLFESPLLYAAHRGGPATVAAGAGMRCPGFASAQNVHVDALGAGYRALTPPFVALDFTFTAYDPFVLSHRISGCAICTLS